MARRGSHVATASCFACMLNLKAYSFLPPVSPGFSKRYMLLRFLRKYFESSSCGSFSLASLIRKHDSRQCHNSLHWHSGCGNCLPQPMCTLVIKTQRSICMFHHCWAIGKFPRWHRHGYGAYLIVYSTVTQCDMSFILWSVVVYTRPARQVFHAPRASITTVRPSFQLDLSPTHWLFAVTSEKELWSKVCSM